MRTRVQRLQFEKKKILAMQGHGGQRILIDFENEKIVSIQSIRMDYNYKKLVLDPFKKN